MRCGAAGQSGRSRLAAPPSTRVQVPVFPETYTPSALLGCVDVVDCLTVRRPSSLGRERGGTPW